MPRGFTYDPARGDWSSVLRKLIDSYPEDPNIRDDLMRELARIQRRLADNGIHPRKRKRRKPPPLPWRLKPPRHPSGRIMRREEAIERGLWPPKEL